MACFDLHCFDIDCKSNNARDFQKMIDKYLERAKRHGYDAPYHGDGGSLPEYLLGEVFEEADTEHLVFPVDNGVAKSRERNARYKACRNVAKNRPVRKQRRNVRKERPQKKNLWIE